VKKTVDNDNDSGVVLMDDLDTTDGDAVEEENTEDMLAESVRVDVLTGSVTVDVNAGDDLSDNDREDDSGWLNAGDDVNCNDEVSAGIDEKLSTDLVVIATTVGLPLGVMRGVTVCVTALLTAVGVSNTLSDKNVTCDELCIARSDETNVS